MTYEGIPQDSDSAQGMDYIDFVARRYDLLAALEEEADTVYWLSELETIDRSYPEHAKRYLTEHPDDTFLRDTQDLA